MDIFLIFLGILLIIFNKPLAAHVVSSREWLPKWMHADEGEQRIAAVVVGCGSIVFGALGLFHVISD
jgi:hypothetical protein